MIYRFGLRMAMGISRLCSDHGTFSSVPIQNLFFQFHRWQGPTNSGKICSFFHQCKQNCGIQPTDFLHLFIETFVAKLVPISKKYISQGYT